MTELQQVLQVCRLEGVIVRYHPYPLLEGEPGWNLTAMTDLSITIWGQPPEYLLPWFLLHELGHVMQMRSGYLPADLFDARYGSKTAMRTDETRAIERDAWRRAGRLAKRHGIQITERARAAGRRALRTYDDQ